MFIITNRLFSAIAFGAAFTHTASFILSAPVFGAAFQKAREAETPRDFLQTKEAASAGILYTSSFVGSGLQSYGMAALLHLTGVATGKAALVVGGLVFAATCVPTLINATVLEKRPLEQVMAKLVTNLLDTVGLAIALTWWGYGESAITL